MTKDAQIRKLRVRSWRRGTREMDLLLGQFADQHLARMSCSEVELYEEFLNEGDPAIADLLFARSFSNRYDALVREIRTHHSIGQEMEK